MSIFDRPAKDIQQVYTMQDVCVCCGRYVPEGSQICKECNKLGNHYLDRMEQEMPRKITSSHDKAMVGISERIGKLQAIEILLQDKSSTPKMIAIDNFMDTVKVCIQALCCLEKIEVYIRKNADYETWKGAENILNEFNGL